MSVQGPGPGPRYGHVMALVGQRYLMAIGGNDGNYPNAISLALRGLVVFVCENLLDITLLALCFPGKRPLADVWALDTAAKPYEWRKLEPEGEGPPPCMYASVSMNSALLDSDFVITICILVLNSYEHVIGFVCFFKFLKLSL